MYLFDKLLLILPV